MLGQANDTYKELIKNMLIPFGEELRRAMFVYLKIRNEVLPGKNTNPKIIKVPW